MRCGKAGQPCGALQGRVSRLIEKAEDAEHRERRKARSVRQPLKGQRAAVALRLA